MSLDKKILSEIQRYQKINQYIIEQAGDVPADPGLAALTPPAPAPEAGAPAPAEAPLPAPETPQPIDVESDPEVEKIDDEGKSEEEESGSEELDITELVDSQKNIEKKQEEYFNNLFSQLQNLESKLGEMDNLVNKINDLETKFDRFRPKTPVEKLELRSLDSGPFNQKLSDFFEDKQDDFEKSGKDQYVITPDEVENFQPTEIKKSFRNFGEEEDFKNI